MKSSFAKALVTVLALTLVAGCGTGANGTSGSENKSATDPKSQSGSSTQPVEIEYWSWQPRENQWPQIQQAFEAKHPNIKVKFVRLNRAPYLDKIKVSMMSGKGPDVFAMSFGSLIYPYFDYAEPLEPYAKKTWGDKWQDQFYSFPVQWAAKYGYKAMPWGLEISPLIAYNVELFDKEGLKPPATYEDVKAALKKFKENSIPGVEPYLGIGAQSEEKFLDLFYVLANQINNTKIKAADEGKAQWTDPVFVKAANLIKQMVDDKVLQPGMFGVPTYPNLTFDEFLKNRYPMIVSGSYFPGSIGVDKEFKRFALVPFPNLQGGQPISQIGVGQAVVLNKNSKHKEAAWEFIAFMSGGENQEMTSKVMEQFPVKKGLSWDSSLLTSDAQKSSRELVVDLANRSATQNSLEHAATEHELYVQLQKFLGENKPIEQALADVQKVSAKEKR